MSPRLNDHIVSDEYRDTVAAKGFALYNDRLRAVLESAHNNKYVVIHVDSGDYAVGLSITAAKKELRGRHPCDGRLLGMKIGMEPDYGLSRRIMAGGRPAKADA